MYNSCSCIHEICNRKKGSPAKRRCQPCVVGSGDLYDLEPGEIPGSNYKPPPPIPFRRTTEYPGIPSLIDLPFIEYITNIRNL